MLRQLRSLVNWKITSYLFLSSFSRNNSLSVLETSMCYLSFLSSLNRKFYLLDSLRYLFRRSAWCFIYSIYFMFFWRSFNNYLFYSINFLFYSVKFPTFIDKSLFSTCNSFILFYLMTFRSLFNVLWAAFRLFSPYSIDFYS